ncbi:MAG: hypothetical protein QOF40_3226 [Actinomycetota bacterium]|nr:hypothetical protein [Actinomycetota bacterium]
MSRAAPHLPGHEDWTVRFRWRRTSAAALIGLVALFAAEGSAGAKGATSASHTQACATSTRIGALRAFTGVRVPSERGTVWALAQGQVPPKVGDSLKIVWRVTGSGPLQVTFTGPSGAAKPLDFGPEPHLVSTFRHPGDEWGTGFGFDAPGCWKIRVVRTGARASVRLTVSVSTR